MNTEDPKISTEYIVFVRCMQVFDEIGVHKNSDIRDQGAKFEILYTHSGRFWSFNVTLEYYLIIVDRNMELHCVWVLA